jgi:hypothetical protein
VSYRVTGPAGEVGAPTRSIVMAAGHARSLARADMAAMVRDDEGGAVSVARHDDCWQVEPASLIDPAWRPRLAAILTEHGDPK